MVVTVSQATGCAPVRISADGKCPGESGGLGNSVDLNVPHHKKATGETRHFDDIFAAGCDELVVDGIDFSGVGSRLVVSKEGDSEVIITIGGVQVNVSSASLSRQKPKAKKRKTR